MGQAFTFDRRWHFEVTPARLWEVLARTGDYPGWWSWLHDFESDGLHPGAAARFTVRPPLPYRLHVTVAIEAVFPAERVEARIGGDLEGTARLEVAPCGDGCEARLVWSLTLARPLLLRMERVARPAMVWGHDAVVGVGVRQFHRRALRGSS
ncbi:MAG: SRPBCC family protein [Actinomycetota bacterium]|nr:SRPBCC family protein [Actinomycetota bacterium]